VDGKFIPIEKGTEYEASYLPNEGEDGVTRVQATRTGSAGTQIKTSFFKGKWQTFNGEHTLKTPHSTMSYTHGPVTVPTNGDIWADKEIVVKDPTAKLSEFTTFPEELPLPDGTKPEGPTRCFEVVESDKSSEPGDRIVSVYGTKFRVRMNRKLGVDRTQRYEDEGSEKPDSNPKKWTKWPETSSWIQYVTYEPHEVGGQTSTGPDNASAVKSGAGGDVKGRDPVFDKWGGVGSSTDNSPVNSDPGDDW